MRKLEKYTRLLFLLIFVFGIFTIILASLLSIIFKESNIDFIATVLTCIGTALVSAGIAVFLFKYDIIELYRVDTIDRSGLLSIAKGQDVFADESTKRELKADEWIAFMKTAKRKEIDILGICMYGFLQKGTMLEEILKLLKRGYKINITFAHPESEELRKQDKVEGRHTGLWENIEKVLLRISEIISRSEFNTEDECLKNFHVYLSPMLPRYFIVRSGRKMTVTPYLYHGPYNEPTLIAEERDWSIYERYKNYIDDVNRNSIEITECLRKKRCDRTSACPVEKKQKNTEVRMDEGTCLCSFMSIKE